LRLNFFAVLKSASYSGFLKHILIFGEKYSSCLLAHTKGAQKRKKMVLKGLCLNMKHFRNPLLETLQRLFGLWKSIQEAASDPEKSYRKQTVTGKFCLITTSSNEGWNPENINQSQRWDF
jgi:hypothetical protein